VPASRSPNVNYDRHGCLECGVPNQEKVEQVPIIVDQDTTAKLAPTLPKKLCGVVKSTLFERSMTGFVAMVSIVRLSVVFAVPILTLSILTST
jgi:hypothetical protein